MEELYAALKELVKKTVAEVFDAFDFTSVINQAIGNYDFDDIVCDGAERVIKKYDFAEHLESAMEEALANHDFSDAVENALSDHDFADDAQSALDNLDTTDLEDKIKESLQEEITDELKDTLYTDLFNQLSENLAAKLKTQNTDSFVANDTERPQQRVTVTMTLKFSRDYIADCVKIGKAAPTLEELQWLIKQELQPMLKQAGEVVTDAAVLPEAQSA